MENWGSVLLHSLFRCCGAHVKAFLPEGRGSLSTYSLCPICHSRGLLHGAFTPCPWWSALCVGLNIPLLPGESKAIGSCSKKSLVYIEIVSAKGIGAGLWYCLEHPPHPQNHLDYHWTGRAEILLVCGKLEIVSCLSLGSLIKQHIFFGHYQCTCSSVLFHGEGKRKECWDAWLPGAHDAVREETSTTRNNQYGRHKAVGLAVSTAHSLFPGKVNCDHLGG